MSCIGRQAPGTVPPGERPKYDWCTYEVESTTHTSTEVRPCEAHGENANLQVKERDSGGTSSADMDLGRLASKVVREYIYII